MGIVALTAAVALSAANPVHVSTEFGIHSAPAGVMPEPLKLNLGGFVEKGPAEGKGRRKYKTRPAPGLPKAS